MPERKVLVCKLMVPVISKHAEFIAKGTPVEVIGWGRDCQEVPASNARLRVRVSAYLHPTERGGECRSGLEIEVEVSQLEFISAWPAHNFAMLVGNRPRNSENA